MRKADEKGTRKWGGRDAYKAKSDDKRRVMIV